MKDAKYQRYFCAQPFANASVDGNGNVYLCCAAFLNTHAGNLLKNTFDEVWNSESAQELRRSILDGSYSHCIEARCPFLQGEVLLQTKDEITDPVFREIIDEGKTELEQGPRELHAAYDTTCNLACPYCRSDYIALSGDSFSVAEQIHQRVVEGALPITGTLVVSSQGDPFASKLYSRILRDFDPEKFPRLKLRMTTNGILFTPENWESIRASHAALEHIHVSVNGASKESFEANQRGGSWEKLCENLAFMSAYCRENGDVRRFVTLSFIVQKNNYREMPDFVRLVQRHGFNRAHFGMIFHADRTFTDAEFAKLAVHWPNHPEYHELQRVMAHPALREAEAFVVGGLAVHLPSIRRYFGYHTGDVVSGAAHWHAEGVDWAGWARDLGLADMEGVSTPKMIAFAGPRPGDSARLPLEAVAERVHWDEEPLAAARAALVELRDGVAALLESAAEPGAQSPLRATAEAVRRGDLATPEAAMAFLFNEAGRVRPAGANMSYADRFARMELEFRQRLFRLVEPRQRKAFLGLPINTLFDIETGHEPLLARLKALVLEGRISGTASRDRISWREFTAMLGMGPEEETAKQVVSAFKTRVAALFGEAPAAGGPAPVQVIADSIRGKTDADLDALLRTQGPQAGGTYADTLGALEQGAREELGAALSPTARGLLPWLPITSLMSIDIPGHDPIGAAVGAVLRG